MKDEVVIGAMWQLQQAMGRKIHLPNLEWENNNIKLNGYLYKKDW